MSVEMSILNAYTGGEHPHGPKSTVWQFNPDNFLTPEQAVDRVVPEKPFYDELDVDRLGQIPSNQPGATLYSKVKRRVDEVTEDNQKKYLTSVEFYKRVGAERDRRLEIAAKDEPLDNVDVIQYDPVMREKDGKMVMDEPTEVDLDEPEQSEEVRKLKAQYGEHVPHRTLVAYAVRRRPTTVLGVTFGMWGEGRPQIRKHTEHLSRVHDVLRCMPPSVSQERRIEMLRMYGLSTVTFGASAYWPTFYRGDDPDVYRGVHNNPEPAAKPWPDGDKLESQYKHCCRAILDLPRDSPGDAAVLECGLRPLDLHLTRHAIKSGIKQHAMEQPKIKLRGNRVAKTVRGTTESLGHLGGLMKTSLMDWERPYWDPGGRRGRARATDSAHVRPNRGDYGG
jgi:hypothetical protein